MTLRLRTLSCSKGGRQLFRDVDCTVPAGTWLYVAGANGVGKTSLLRMLCGLAPVEHGEITWQGASIHAEKEAYRRDMRYLGHLNALQDSMSVAENLDFACALHGVAPNMARRRAVLQRFGLQGRDGQLARYLSQGQRRRVALSRLVLSPAKLWILDEPFVAMDESGVRLLAQTIAEHLHNGGSAVITSHQTVPIGELEPQVLQLGGER